MQRAKIAEYATQISPKMQVPVAATETALCQRPCEAYKGKLIHDQILLHSLSA